jgi:predicted amidohydrolase
MKVQLSFYRTKVVSLIEEVHKNKSKIVRFPEMNNCAGRPPILRLVHREISKRSHMGDY